jgi:hypothetical protein
VIGLVLIERPSTATAWFALILSACGGEPPPAAAPTAAPPADAGGAAPKRTVDDLRPDFMARCEKNMPDAPEYCACAWTQMAQLFTAEELERKESDAANVAKFEIVKAHVSQSCGRSMPEARIRASFVKICAGGNPGKGPFCECTWTELRKTFEPGDMADPEFAKTPRFRAVAAGAVPVCVDKMPEDVVRAGFMQGCQSGREELETFCSCAWGAIRTERSAADVGAQRVDISAMRPKIDKACGKPPAK